MNILLIGFKKSGKTTTGKLLSSFLSKKFIDVDDVIIDFFLKKYKKKLKIFDIFCFLKEKGFRKLEKEAYLSLKGIENYVIATSGGMVLSDQNFSIFEKEKIVIYTKTSFEILKKRIQLDKKNIFQNNDFFIKEHNKRERLYEKYSDFIIQTDNKKPLDICLRIKDFLYV